MSNQNKTTDQQLMQNYIDCGVNNNLITANVLNQRLKQTTNILEKRILYIKIFFELIQTTENLQSVLSALKSQKRGFWEYIINHNVTDEETKEFWQEINNNKYKDMPFEYITKVLKFKINKNDYNQDKKVYDGIYKGIYAALKNRLGEGKQDKNRRLLVRCYNKIKHGFPIWIEESGPIKIYIKANNKKLEHIPFTFKEAETDKFVGSIEAFTNTIKNLLRLFLQNKIN